MLFCILVHGFGKTQLSDACAACNQGMNSTGGIEHGCFGLADRLLHAAVAADHGLQAVGGLPGLSVVRVLRGQIVGETPGARNCTWEKCLGEK